MTEKKTIDILDLVLFMFERKKKIVYIFICSLFISYGAIYIFVEEQFESAAVIIPSDDENISGLSGMLKGLKSLPMGLGSSAAKSSVNRYNTIIFSRTSLESIIQRFDLMKVYDIDSTALDAKEKAMKVLRKNILTNETKDDAFEIVVRANTAQLSADMVNYIVDYLNKTIIELKIQKSSNNRKFLGERVNEIYRDLFASEDSLRKYQERSGLYDIKSQIPEIVAMYAKLETEVMTKQVQQSILERLYDKENPEVKNLGIQISEYQKKIQEIKSSKGPDNVVIGMKNLPSASIEFLRRYRMVEINSTLLEFVLPLYEQAKIEEKKDYPILQIIDYGIPPGKKSWPPRTLFAFFGAIFSVIGYLLYLFIDGKIRNSLDPKMLRLREQMAKLFSRNPLQ